MNSKYDFLNLTESNQFLNLTSDNQNQTVLDPYIPLQTEAYLGVNYISIKYIILKLQSLADWRNIHDIVRSSIRSLTNIVRNQGLAIKEMSKSLSSKIGKSDVELALSQKSDISDFNKMAVELKSLIQKKASNEQVNQLLSDKISKNE